MNRNTACLATILLIGAALRLVGITRGNSDALGEVSFRAFHPDEATLIRAALVLDDPTEPPLTAYGLLPLYIARLSLNLVDPNPTPSDFGQSFAVYLTLRLIAVGVSCASLWLVYAIGRRCYDAASACLATFFIAVAPLALQLAHYFTVDGLFTLFALAVVWAALRLVERPTDRRYILAGLLVSAAAAVRFNGVLLGLVVAAADVAAQYGEDDRGRLGFLRKRGLLLSALAAVAMLLLLQPYLLVSPGLLQRDQVTDDFAFSAKIASGEFLRLWSLADVHTLPYLHFWTDLMPQAVGWPLALALLGGAAAALWSRQAGPMLLVAWSIAYFAVVGWLHTKHVRYLWPMLPFLGIAAAGLGIQLCRARDRRLRIAGVLAVTLVVLYSGWYGIAFGRIYTVEDSRLQAARWVRSNLPAGATVGLERGAFSMAPLTDAARHKPQSMGMPILFGSRGYLSCEATHAFLYDTIRQLDYIVGVDVNRRQFAAVPDLFPVVAGFYAGLDAGTLGFKRIKRFKVYPSFAGFSNLDDAAEPSFVAYDHPAVSIYQRDRELDAAWARWKAELLEDERCVDAAAVEVAEAIGAGDMGAAHAALKEIRQTFPEACFTGFIEADLQMQADKKAGQLDGPSLPGEALYLSGFADRSRAAYLLPWATGHSLLHLGLPDQALKALTMGAMMPFEAADRLPMARAYISLANKIRGDVPRHAHRVYELSVHLHPLPEACNVLGATSQSLGQFSAASSWWRRSLDLDPRQASVHASLAHLHLRHLGDRDRAREHAQRAALLDSTLRDEMNLLLAPGDPPAPN